MKLDSKKLSLALVGGLILSVIAFFIIALHGLSILNNKSHSLVDLKAQSQSQYNELINLVQAKKEVQKYGYFKNIAKTVIPDEKNQAQAVLEINQMAALSGMSIQSITFPISTLGGSSAAASAVVQKDATSTSTSSTSSALSQAKAVPGIAGLYSLQLTINFASAKDAPPDQQVTYSKMLDFLKRIENNRHTAQITQVSIQPASAGQALTFALVINTFIKP
jgi:hypothetical protein